MSKKLLFLLLNIILTTGYAINQNWTSGIIDNFGGRAQWDITQIYQGSATLRRVAIGNHIKSISDDTNRIFTVQSASPRMVLLCTDTSSALPMKWRTDILETSSAGFMQVGIGDVDRNGLNDLVYARSANPYCLKRAFWSGTDWAFDTILTMGGSSWAMTVGDADNDGYDDDIIYSQGTTSSCRMIWAHYNGATWDTSTVWTGDGTTMQSIAIADFDTTYTGNEVVVVGTGVSGAARVMRVRWTGSLWDTLTLYQSPANGSFTAVAVGDFDSLNYGNEIAVGNGLGPGSMVLGTVLEVCGAGTNWHTRSVFTPDSNENCWGLAVGDFLSTHPGDEIVKSSSFSYYVRAIWGAGDTWHNEVIFEIPGSSFGAAVGDVNRHRPYNDEIVLTGNNCVFEAEEHFMPGIENALINKPLDLVLKIMPNPAKNNVRVYYTLPTQSLAELKLYNVVGKLVYSVEIPASSTKEPQNVHVLDARFLTTGIYILQFNAAEFKTTRKLLITK